MWIRLWQWIVLLFFIERQVFEMAGLDYLIEKNVIDALEEAEIVADRRDSFIRFLIRWKNIRILNFENYIV